MECECLPSIMEHGDHCEALYGVRAEDLHRWIDSPVILDGPMHRRFRHYVDSMIPYKFIKKYGDELSRNILLDHIMLDKKENDDAVNYVDLMRDHMDEKKDLINGGDVVGDYLDAHMFKIREYFGVEGIPAWFVFGLITWKFYPEVYLENKSILRVMAECDRFLKRNYDPKHVKISFL